MTKLPLNGNIANEILKLFKAQASECHAISLFVSVGGYDENHEVVYEVLQQPIVLHTDIGDLEYHLYNLEELNNIIDDSLFDFLQGEYEASFDLEEFLNQKVDILSADTVFLKIKYDEIKIPNKEKGLYFLLKNHNIKDKELAESFLIENFNLDYADLLLQYDISETTANKYLNDPNVSSFVYLEYTDRNAILAPVDDIIATKDKDQISEYYLKLVKQEDFSSFDALKIIKKGIFNEEVLEDFIDRYEIDFVAEPVLTHPLLKESRALEFAKNKSFHKFLIKNPSITQDVLNIICEYTDDKNILIELDKNITLSDEMKTVITKKLSIVS